MKLPAAWTKRTGQPRWAQRVEIAMYSFGILVELRAAAADVDGRLARVADPVDDRDHRLAVGVGGEVVGRSDPLPGLLRAVEDRRNGEADHRQRDRDDARLRRWPGRRSRTRCGESSSRPRSSPRAWASRGPGPACSCPPGQPSEERWSDRKSSPAAASPSRSSKPPDSARSPGGGPERGGGRFEAGAHSGLGLLVRGARRRPRSRSTQASQRAAASRAARSGVREPSCTWAARLIRSESSRTAARSPSAARRSSPSA